MPKLKFLMSNGKTGDIKRKAIATFTSMKKAAPTKATEEEPKEEESQNSTTTNNTATTTATSDAPLGNATNKTSIASGKRSGATFGFESSSTSSATSKNAATTITLYIKELSCETAKTDFERAMVNFRGVVSFWVELKSHRAVVRTTLTQEQLISAVSTQLGWLSSTEASFVSPKNAGYLDEEEIGVNGAIVQRGKSKKAKEAQAQGGGGWFSTVASYIW